MFLHSIQLSQFKNHESQSFHFSRKINCFIGPNGVGKTNILDAIHYICLTKSYFNATDQQNIQFEKDFLRVVANIRNGATQMQVVCKLPLGKKKEFLLNEIPYLKMSDHIGVLPVVMLTPDDNQLILGSSEERRKFIDNTISQVDRAYLDHLILYNKYLDQRNALLKSINSAGKRDDILLENYNSNLVKHGEAIYLKRKEALDRLAPIFRQYHQLLCLEREETTFVYDSMLHNGKLADMLIDKLAKEIMLERTLAGPHRDDIQFLLNNNKLKRFGSQGQQKSFLIALKLAQFDFISNSSGVKPFLLIDDIFDKIDEERSRQLVNLLSTEHFGQLFITDTDPKHIEQEMAQRKEVYEIFNIL